MPRLLGFLAILTSGCLSTATDASRTAASADIDVARPASKAARDASVAADGSTSCRDLADHIASRHPAPFAALARARASLGRSHAAASGPGPTFWLEVWDFPIGDPALANEQGMYMVGLRQEIPVLAALDAGARAEAEQARADAAESRDARRLLSLQASVLCVDWAVANNVAERTRAYAKHLTEVRDATITAYGAGGRVSLGAIARADGEIARAERRAIEIEEQAGAAREALVGLGGADVPIPKSPPPLPQPPDEMDVDAMIETALAGRGDVAAARSRTASAQARAEGARALADVPKFEIAGTYMQMPGARPGLGAMIAMTMPWIGGGLADASDAAEHESRAAIHQAAAVERGAIVEVRTHIARLRGAQRALQSIEERELPAAERASTAERAALEGGGFDLTAWLLAAHALLESRIEHEMVKGAVARAWIELEAASAYVDAPEVAR